MDIYKYKIKWCPICDQGWIEIFKDKKLNKLFLCCNECETSWNNPEDLKNSKISKEKYNNAIIPTYEEIYQKGWSKYIIQ